MKKTILFFIILLMILFNNNNIFSLFITKDNQSTIEKSGKIYLVIIAIDVYKNRLNLENHVNDAKKIKNLLYSNYNIDKVIELYNYSATYENIENLFIKLKKDLKKEDSLLLYFSGHGYIDSYTNESYWICYDSGINEYLKEFWFPNRKLIEYLDGIISKQVLIINDSSFNNNLIKPIFPDKTSNFNDEYFLDAHSKKSRQFLGSGILETGIDESEFSDILYTTLRKLKKNYIDSVMIYNDIKKKMKESIPLLGEIQDLGHEQGASFVLLPRKQELVEIKEEKKEIKKEIPKEQIISQGELKPINKAGIALLPIGTSFTTAGILILVFDIGFLFQEVEEMINNQSDYSYSEYEELYNLNLALFISGIVVTTVGIATLSASIPLIIIKPKNKKISFNISINNSIEAFFLYKF
jgi:hypothetical protein